MEFRNLKSTRLKKSAYIKDEATLVLKFSDGRQYEYYDVPVKVYTELIHSKSPGKFFDIHIKGKYEYERQT